MDAFTWIGAVAIVAILVSIAAQHWRLRLERRRLFEDKRVDVQSRSANREIVQLRERIAAQGNELRERIDAQGKGMSEEIGQLRERMARLEGLLSGLREAITANRAA